MSKRMRRFLSYYLPYKKLFAMDMVCALIVAIISLTTPLLIRYITNVLIPAEVFLIQPILIVGVIMIGLTAIEFACNFFISYKGHLMGVYMEHDLREDLFSHYQKLSFSFYDNQKTGILMSRLTNDLSTLAELYHHGPEDIIISLIKIFGAFFILLNINALLTFLVFFMIVPMVIFTYYCNKKMKVAFKQNKIRVGEINARIEDNLSGIRVVKSFANETDEINKFGFENSNYVKSKTNAYYAMAQFNTGLTAFITSITVIVVICGSIFIGNGVLIVGDLLTFLLYISNFVEPIKRIINFAEQYQEGMTGFERFMEILEIEPDIQDEKDAIELEDVKGAVSFTDVAFRYNDKSDYVLKNINLQVKPGEYLALVGTSGAGKTTLCSLIPRFYEINKGEIKIDDHNIREIKMRSLRSKIGIVQQDVYLFTGTILDNIRYGRPNATDEEIIEAAKQANAHEFISQLPEGYLTDIGQRGVRLSGGQKQRLSIARVFLKNPPILIFDEATSALDNESEKVVQDSLEALAKNRTTFVIAHRLSTIKNAKRILVLSTDGIIESGNHQELMELNQTYAKLYNMQFIN